MMCPYPVYCGSGLRPFLIQLDLPVENSGFRLKPKWGVFTQSEKGFFDFSFFD